MGNAANRRKLAQLLKTHGFGPLYRGNKKVAWTLLRSGQMNTLFYKLQFKPGDIVEDCNAFNCKIIEWVTEKHNFNQWYRGLKVSNGWVFNVSQFKKEDGGLSCGCAYGPEPAKTREEIEAYMKEWCSNPKLKEDGWITEWHEKILKELESGNHVCDNNGILLPEFKRF